MGEVVDGLLVGVGIAQAGLFFWQLRLIRKGLADTKGAADAARESVELARKTAQRQLRAYVGVSDARVVSSDNGSTFDVEIELTNAGQTPALRVTHQMAVGLQIFRDKPLNFTTSERGRGEAPIPPGGTFILKRPIAIAGPSGVGAVGPQKVIFGWGRVDYRDIFDAPQNIEFRFRSGEPIRAYVGDTMRTVGWKMEAEDQGNTAT